MLTSDCGFEELAHTADWAIRVWAGSLQDLFIEAALGMNVLSDAQPIQAQRIQRTFSAEAPDHESLLVLFLSELVYAAEQEKLVFNRFSLKITGTKLSVGMSGLPIRSISKSIKAVTYHNLQITKTAAGYQVEIIFDV
jgi:SHS2 domain-containing protein